jgi:histidinol-phosphate/aromatic aminotransferase/cobyric acid decarboxylase-like protein
MNATVNWCARTCAISPVTSPHAATWSWRCLAQCQRIGLGQSFRCRRHPAPLSGSAAARPALALAALYDVEPAQLLVGRGSDEAIDLLVRAFCAPGQGAIAIAPPVFGMYAVCARLHGARVIEVPLVDGEQGLRVDLQAIGDAALANGASLVFLCTPGNPSGEALPLIEIAALAVRLRGKALVVVDEAYAEYSDVPSATALLPRAPTSPCCARCRKRMRWRRRAWVACWGRQH